MTIDIIIPVYNRLETLKKTLEALNTQSVLSAVSPRLIIIDDGSTENMLDATKNITAQFPHPWLPAVIISQAHQGIAAARNAGLKVATADVIFFLGADILLRPDALQHHAQFHQQNPSAQAAALGFVMWHPLLKPTPFMDWLVHGGPQNDFDALLGLAQADPRHFFYASHVSLKRSAIGDMHFDQQFSTYGWEDLDFGHQLASQGLQLHVIHQAVGYHDHHYNLQNIRQRQVASGASFALYRHKYAPFTQSMNLGLSRRLKHALAAYLGIFTLMQAIISIWPNQSFPRLYLHLTAHWFLQGFWHNKGQNSSL